jgi:hypothetical protein
VLTLKKSDSDDKHFVNFGIWLKSFGIALLTSDNKRHIQTRLTSLFPADVEMIDLAGRVDDDGKYLPQFADFMRQQVIPLCRECLRKDNLRLMFERGDFKRALIMKEAREALSAD